MRVNVHTDTDSGNITVDADYNETIENILVKCSLINSRINLDRYQLLFNGRRLMPTQRLNDIGFTEGGILVLRERSTSCCALV